MTKFTHTIHILGCYDFLKINEIFSIASEMHMFLNSTLGKASEMKPYQLEISRCYKWNPGFQRMQLQQSKKNTKKRFAKLGIPGDCSCFSKEFFGQAPATRRLGFRSLLDDFYILYNIYIYICTHTHTHTHHKSA